MIHLSKPKSYKQNIKFINKYCYSIYNYPLHDLCCGTIKFTTLDKEIMIFYYYEETRNNKCICWMNLNYIFSFCIYLWNNFKKTSIIFYNFKDLKMKKIRKKEKIKRRCVVFKYEIFLFSFHNNFFNPFPRVL